MNTNVERVFLGWERPVLHSAGDYLLPGSGVRDLGSYMVVVPTRQAGRLLREYLARRAAENGGGLLSPRVTTPAFYLHGRRAAGVAGPVDVRRAWLAVLRDSDPESLDQVLAGNLPRTTERMLSCGEAIQRLREQLSDGAMLIADVPRKMQSDLPEPRRWRQLARLEQLYLEKLRHAGLDDPCAWQIRQAGNPPGMNGIDRIVLAAVPDPSLLTINAVERLAAAGCRVTVLIAAPRAEAAGFDEWGRPLTEFWESRPMETDGHCRLRVADDPAGQVEVAIRALSTEAQRYPAAQAAVGVPDSGIIPFLQAGFEQHDIPCFDPSEIPLVRHPLCRILKNLLSLRDDNLYESFAELLRCHDVLRCLAANQPAAQLLQELDRFHEYILPASFSVLRQRLRGPLAERYPLLAAAAETVDGWLRACREDNLPAALRKIMGEIFGERRLVPGKERDDAFAAVAEHIGRLLLEIEGSPLSPGDGRTGDAPELLAAVVREETWRPDPVDGALPLLGWLELGWAAAPLLVVTGMNEGSVPDSRLGDLFLPDSLRCSLGLRHDRQRAARDAFLLRGLIEARRNGGRLYLVSGRRSAAGDPLKPSRLLFRCNDDELLRRVQLLVRETLPDSSFPAPRSGFRLNPWLSAGYAPIKSLPVTAFRGYLDCPFRFYLRRVRGMEKHDDTRREMDALDFGTLLHSVLHDMAAREELRDCGDGKRLARFLVDEARRWVNKRYGAERLLSVDLALAAAGERLAALAEVHAALVEEGWKIAAVELDLSMKINGVTVRGRIDRVDIHKADGRVRIYDYKSSAQAAKPAAQHVKQLRADHWTAFRIENKTYRWCDLQLPLYRMLLEEDGRFPGPYELAYISLPRAVSDTGVQTWENFDESWYAAAGHCCREVINRIRKGIFWPPAERIDFDDFELLLGREPAKRVMPPESMEEGT